MTVPLHAHKVTARNDGRHIVPLTIVEQKFKFRIELHPCAFESGGDEFWGKCFATASFLSTQYKTRNRCSFYCGDFSLDRPISSAGGAARKKSFNIKHRVK